MNHILSHNDFLLWNLKIKFYYFLVRYDQAPPHRLQKYPSQNMQGPQGPQGPPGPQGPSTHMQGPPSHHQQSQPQPNFNNSYPNSVPQIQHQQSNYYGPQGKQKERKHLIYIKCI